MPLQMNGVEAWITVENKMQVQEYGVDLDQETGVATCWIGGEPGQTFAIRWRDLSDPLACPNGGYAKIYLPPRDLSGFVMMDGYELGGRVLHARSHASAIFSRIATSATSCLPLTFSSLPRSAGIGEDWESLGTISLDIHVVQIGEANRLHEGYSSYRRDEGSPLSSATPFSSTEVTSVRKIATFVFKYRPSDVLQYHSITPMSLPTTPTVPQLGDKRCAPDSDSGSDSDLALESDEDDSGCLMSPTIIFTGSDSDSSQDFTQRIIRPMRPSRTSSYNYGSGIQQLHMPPQAKRMKY